MSILDVPDWLHEYIHDWSQKLRLYEWRIRVRLAMVVDGDEDTMAACLSQPTINTASLTFRADVEQSDEESKRLVVHELLHVAHARIDALIEEVIVMQLPEPARKLAVDAYNQVLEAYTDSMMKAIYHMGCPRLELGAESNEFAGDKPSDTAEKPKE